MLPMTDMIIPTISCEKDFTVEEIAEAFSNNPDIEVSMPSFHAALMSSPLVVKATVKEGTTRRIVGLLQVFNDAEWSAVINYLYVREDYRHKGIGSCLMNTALAYLHGISRIIAMPADVQMLKFYKQLGFKPMGNGEVPVYCKM